MADQPHILVVEARFYEDIADELARAALAVLDRAGATYDRITVPGAFELPGAIAFAHAAPESPGRRRYDGYIALGCVIRGETTHYDYVCQESARGLQDIVLRHHLAVGYGILTVENEEQAWVRARANGEDRGGNASRACLAMIDHRRRFGLGS